MIRMIFNGRTDDLAEVSLFNMGRAGVRRNGSAHDETLALTAPTLSFDRLPGTNRYN